MKQSVTADHISFPSLNGSKYPLEKRSVQAALFGLVALKTVPV